MTIFSALTHTLVSAAFVAVLSQPASANKTSSTEKCYGVAKEGKNDCANASGTHSCAGQSKTDGAVGEWLHVPKGVCERLVGGSLTPK